MSEDESKKRLVNNIFDGDCAVERGASAASPVVFSRNFQLYGDERARCCAVRGGNAGGVRHLQQ